MEWHGSAQFRSLKDFDPKSATDIATVENIDPGGKVLSSSERGNGVQTDKPRKKTMTSAYLKFFEVAPDGKSRNCKFCGQSYSIATATGNLGRHLSSRHPGYDKSGDLVTTIPMQPSASMLKKHQSDFKTPRVDPENLNWLIVKWITLSPLPPAALGERWLLNSFKYLRPSIQLWSCEKFQAVLSELYRTMRDDIRATLDHVSSKVTIALEFWTSYEKVNYMSITCHWIDDSWTFQKVLLDICRIPYPSGGVEIYDALIKVLKMYNIDEKVLACTHDNSQSSVEACHTLKEELDGHKLGLFCYIPCAAQALNMIIEDGLQTTKLIISKIREFVMEMNASPVIMEDFLQFTAAYQEGTWKFPLDSSARWNGHYQMLDIVRKASKSIDGVIRKHENTLGSRILLNAAEKNAVNIMHTYLQPFYKTTNNICADRAPTVGLVLFFMDHISETIAACKDSHHHPDWLKTAAEQMAVKARIFNDQVCNVFTYITAILDPRIKMELISESLNSQSNLEEARTHFLRNYYSSHFSSMANMYGAQDRDDGACLSFAEEIARKKRRASASFTSDELSHYLSEPPAPVTTVVLEWWKVNSGRYPCLSIMARDYLPVQPTSVAPEELFCSKGDETEKERFGLPCATTQGLLCVKSWTESGFKLKYQSTEIDCDRLMELTAEGAGEKSRTVSSKLQK